MTADERDRVTDQLTVLAEYYERPKSEAQIVLYVQALDDLACDAVIRAMCALVRTSTFFPRVSEIRAVAEGRPSDAAELAWMALLREIRRVGYLGTPDLPNITLETVRGLWVSWAHCCTTLPGEGPELIGWMKRWDVAYGATANRLTRPELIGREDAKQLVATLTTHQS